LSQPGWYSDPLGSGRLRWWDGQRWTEHVHPPEERPAQQSPQAQQAHQAQQAQQPQQPQQGDADAVVADVRGYRLHADQRGIAYGAISMIWAVVEWVAYWPTGQGQWVFQVGREPFHGGARVEVVCDQEDLWSQLVELCRSQVEPRLVAELAGRVRAGEQIDVGAGLAVHPDGLSGGQVSLSWAEVGGASIRDGRVWLHRAESETPVLYVPQQNPNAVIIPALLSELKR